MTSLLIWSQLVIKVFGGFAWLTLFVCACVALDSSRQTDKMWPIPDTDLPYAVGRRRSDFLEQPTPCTLLALFPKELSCCVTMEISGCYCRNASIIAENICGLINYPDKLFFAFSASSVFRYWAEEGKDPESLEVCGEKLMELQGNQQWKRLYGELQDKGISQWTGRTEGESRVKKQMAESLAIQSTTINKHKTEILSVYSGTILLTLHNTRRWKGLYSLETDFSVLKGKIKEMGDR